jgi:uncharacterized membrane protein
MNTLITALLLWPLAAWPVGRFVGRAMHMMGGSDE